MPATLFRKRRFLSKMSASGMESGIMDEYRLSGSYDFAGFCVGVSVVIIFLWIVFKIVFPTQIFLFFLAFLLVSLCAFHTLRLCVKIQANSPNSSQSNQSRLNYRFCEFHCS